MSRMFSVDAVYTKENFIAIFKEIKAGVDPSDPFMTTVDKNIAWAEEHPEETIFEWRIRPDGVIVPDAHVWLNGKDLLDELKATE